MTISEQIKQQLEIKDVLERYTDIRFSENRRRFPCPVHKGTHNNFAVYAESNSFYCFSCGAGGDCVKLAALLFSVSYRGAAELLDRDFGLGIFFGEGRPLRESKNRQREYRQKQLRQKQQEEASAKAYDLLVRYYKWLLKQPETKEVTQDMEFVQRRLDYHLNLRNRPVTYDMRALVRALYSKHRKEGT